MDRLALQRLPAGELRTRTIQAPWLASLSCLFLASCTLEGQLRVVRLANGAVEFTVSSPDPEYPRCIKTFNVVTGSGDQTRALWSGIVRDTSLCTVRLVYGSSPPGYDISTGPAPLSGGHEYSASFSTEGPTIARQFRLEAAPLPAGATQVDVPTYR